MTTKVSVDMVEDSINYLGIPFIIVTPSVTSYTFANLKQDFTIDGIDFKVSTGDLDLKIKINSTDVVWVTDGATLDVTNASQDDTAASANVFASGDNLVFDVSNLGSTPTKLEITIHCTRT